MLKLKIASKWASEHLWGGTIYFALDSTMNEYQKSDLSVLYFKATNMSITMQ